MKPTPQQLKKLWQDVEQALIDFELDKLRGKFAGNGARHKLILEPNGTIRYSLTPGESVSREEYYGIVPHERTIVEETAQPWYPGPGEDNPGWLEKDGEIDMTVWCGYEITAEQAEPHWREILTRWIDAGNFRPIE